MYGGGDNSGAPFRNDFVEVYNRGTTTIDFSVTPYSLQYASVGSNFASGKTNLTSGMIAAGRYFLIQEAGGTTNGVALPTPDAVGTISIGSTSGKVALVAGTNALAAATCPGDDGSSPFNPNNSLLADLVGYGGSATSAGHCYEGAGPAAAPSNSTAGFRKAGGCVETGQNNSDFFVASPSPRNSNSPIGDCKPEITVNDVTVTEGNTGTVNAIFTVTLSAISNQTVIVNYATADGTAVAAADYQTQSGVLTFNPGDLTKTITVLVNGDLLDEPSETFLLNLFGVANGVLLDSQGQGTINDNDPAPSLSINDVPFAEGDAGVTPFGFTVSLSAASGRTITVDYATVDNTAVAGFDYQSTSGVLTFQPGETSKQISVLVNGDTEFEPNETFSLVLSSPTNATISDAQGQGTILNDDPAPPTLTLSVDDVSIIEGNSGNAFATFQVTLSPASSNTVMVDFETANATATATGNDFQTAVGTLIFSPGEVSKTISISINGDTLVEVNETFVVNLSNATGGAVIGKPAGTGIIQNDDTASLVISQVYGGGNNSGAAFRNDFVEIFNRGTTTVDFSIVPYSVQYASVGSNFGTNKTNLTSGTVAPGKYFLVQEAGGTTNGVALPTPDATGAINLSASAGKVALVAGINALSGACPGDDGTSPFNSNSSSTVDFVGYGDTAGTTGHCYEGAGPSPATANASALFRRAGGCTDSDLNTGDFFLHAPLPRNSNSSVNNCTGAAVPNLTINDVTVTEGNSGSTTATFTVTLSAPAQGADVTFNISTQNNTALSGSDYVSKALTNQVIPAGRTSLTFDVIINGDTTVEPDETFFVNVTNVSGAHITDGQGIGTIQHDDLPTLSIDDVSGNESDSGPKTFTFHVSLSAPAPADVTFDIATADGTAQDGESSGEDNDYQAHSASRQTIPAGDSSFDFQVSVKGDLTIEPDEIFFVNVNNISGATVLDGQGQGTIQNDDSPVLSIDDVFGTEGNNGSSIFIFHVTLSIPAGPGGVTFDIATTDGSAHDHNPTTEDNDYVAVNTTQTIPAGESSYNFAVTVTGDTKVETDETFSVNVTNVLGASVSDGTGLGTIQNDDLPVIVISQLYGGGGNSGAGFKNDFIEIFNRGATTVDLTGWSVQYSSATGTGAWSVTPLCPVGPCLLLPGRYFLVQEAQGAGGTTNLPDPDATGTIAMTASAGKVALVSNISPLSGACPSGAAILDQVGYGSSATCFEGSNGPASAPANTTADLRKGGGCLDLNDNAGDFFTHAPAPRNSNTAANVCNGQTADVVISDATVTEGDGGTASANFTVSLIAPSASTVSVEYATTDNTAVTPTDYQSAAGTVTFNPGDLSKTVTVFVNSDLLDEPNETFFLNLTNVVNGVLLDSQGQGIIIDNDPTPSLSINDVALAEGDAGVTDLSFTLSLSAASGRSITVNYASVDNTAVAGADYQSTSGMLAFSPGDTSKQITVLITGDAEFEPNETFSIMLSGATNATIFDAEGQATILNDDPAPPTPTLSIDDANIIEGNSGSSTITFQVSLSPSSSNPVTVDFATANGTATTGGTDYQAAGGTLAFSPGETSKPVSISINGDTLVEGHETLIVNLSNATGGAVIGKPSGTGTIQNDDLPVIVISQLYGGGGNSGAGFKNDFIEIFNRGATTVDLTGWSVQYSSATGTGAWSVTPLCPVGPCLLLPGRYFLVQEAQGAGGTTNLPDPDATGTIAMTASAGKVAVVSNTSPLTGACPSGAALLDQVGYGSSATCFEGSNGPASTPANTTADIRKGGGCVDVNDNASDFFTHAPAPRNSDTPANVCSGQTADVVISDATVTEGDGGTASANFIVTLIAPSASTVTVDYTTADNTAASPADYQSAAGTVTFSPGEVSKSITVIVKGDTLDEPGETFLVTLDNATNAAILDRQGQGTIIDDDVPPTLSIDDVSKNETNDGTTTFAFTVHLSAPALTGGVTFDIATADGTAEDGNPPGEDNDYVAQSVTGINIPVGSQDYIFNVTVNGDTAIESNESFFVNVTNVAGATIGDAQGQGTIQNDDSPALTINDVTQSEGDSGTSVFSFTVTSSLPAPIGGITFDISTADGTAQDDNPASEDNDYLPRNLTGQTIPAGQSTYTFDVTVNGDTRNEAICETFLVNLSNPVNATILDGQGQGGIIDEDGSKLVISQIYGGGSNSGATFQNDFVELFNRGSSTVDFSVTPYSVQYASAAGTFSSGNTISLTAGSIAPGQYFLIKLAPATPTIGAALPTADATNTGINLSATDGKVALVIGTSVATTTSGCPTGVTISDLIGFGAANCSETAATSALNATRSARRNASCIDTNKNSTDFTVVSNPAAPRNSATTLSPCGCSTSYSSQLKTFDDSLKGSLVWLATLDLSFSNASFSDDLFRARSPGVSTGPALQFRRGQAAAMLQ
ncbi:MAG: Calx-beta domain-containing protein [Acidobacteriota bacterium]